MINTKEGMRMEGNDYAARAQALQRLAAQCRTCTRCRLRAGCQGVVFGEGNAAAKLMFIGEGPGADEDRLGRPFVGKAGQLLDKILQAAGIAREEVYIANVVKCRPPQNRVPQPDEAAACLPHLRRQAAIIRPKIIVCLGATAARYIIDPTARISQIRGQWIERKGCLLTATFHPAALLRDPAKKKLAWADFQKIRDVYRQLDKT